MIFGDMHKTYDKVIINCKNMATEACVNTANRFDPCTFSAHVQYCFIGFYFVFMLFYCIFSVKNHVFPEIQFSSHIL